MLKFQFKGYGLEHCSNKGFVFICAYPDPKNPGQLVHTGTNKTCREYFVRVLREKINSAAGKNVNMPYARRAYALVSFGKPSKPLVKSWGNALNLMAEKSLYIINSFEKHHKWQLTKLYPVEYTDTPMIFFSGPKRWTMSPYHMSLWTLMVRAGRNSWLPKNLRKLNHENLVRQIAITSASSNYKDSSQIYGTIRDWDPFMALHKELFGKENRRYHWRKGHLYGGNDRPEGIYRLVKGTTQHHALKREYTKLKKEVLGLK